MIPASIIVDDFPLNASYWARLQQQAFGFIPNDQGAYGQNWREQSAAPFIAPAVVEGFADVVEEFNLRGKFSVVACPAGLGRIDQSIRHTPAGYLDDVLDVVRKRIAPRFDITPEVLTHTMALDPTTGALLPHTETAWLSHLAATGQREAIVRYVEFAWKVLENAGFSPAGITVGGLPDPSGIAKGEMLLAGHHRQPFMSAVLDVLASRREQPASTFLYTFGKATREPYESTGLPEPILRAPDGRVAHELLAPFEDPLLEVFAGRGDPIAAADALVSRDLASGQFIDCVQSGKALVINIHAQTLNSLNTGLGLQLFREAIRRLRERYGKELCWLSATELCARSVQLHGTR